MATEGGEGSNYAVLKSYLETAEAFKNMREKYILFVREQDKQACPVYLGWKVDNIYLPHHVDERVNTLLKRKSHLILTNYGYVPKPSGKYVDTLGELGDIKADGSGQSLEDIPIELRNHIYLRYYFFAKQESVAKMKATLANKKRVE